MTTIAPGSEENTPLISSRFEVKFGDIVGQFTEVSGLSIDIEEVESVVVKDGKSIARWSPGTVKYSEMTLKREFTGDRAFWDWHKVMVDGNKDGAGYVDGSVILKDRADTAKVTWGVKRAWPSKWSCSDLDAGSGDTMIEEITLQVEFLEREK